MNKSLSETKLPNGMKIFCLRKDEVNYIYNEIPGYFKNGIEVHEGDTVFDVGANIGLFSLLIYQQCNQNVNVYAFEPIPAVFEVLEANAQRFDPEKLKVFPYGLSVESKTVTFAYHPNCSVWSTSQIDTLQEQHDEIRRFVPLMSKMKAEDLPDSSPMRWFLWLPPFLKTLIIEQKLKPNFRTEEVTCQLRSLSEVVAEHNIPQIDLLKVDVEKSELEVLLGIAEDDWSKIKQVVVEIHDIEHRVETVKDLLKQHGFSRITVEQEPLFVASNIFTLYATCK